PFSAGLRSPHVLGCLSAADGVRHYASFTALLPNATGVPAQSTGGRKQPAVAVTPGASADWEAGTSTLLSGLCPRAGTGVRRMPQNATNGSLARPKMTHGCQA